MLSRRSNISGAGGTPTNRNNESRTNRSSKLTTATSTKAISPSVVFLGLLVIMSIFYIITSNIVFFKDTSSLSERSSSINGDSNIDPVLYEKNNNNKEKRIGQLNKKRKFRHNTIWINNDDSNNRIMSKISYKYNYEPIVVDVDNKKESILFMDISELSIHENEMKQSHQNNAPYRSCHLSLLNKQQQQQQQQQELSLDDKIIHDLCQHVIGIETNPSYWTNRKIQQLSNDSTNNKKVNYMYYNSLLRDRYICGQQVKPKSFIMLNEPCNILPSRLFESTPGRPLSSYYIGKTTTRLTNKEPPLTKIQQENSKRNQKGINLYQYGNVNPIQISFQNFPVNDERPDNNYAACDVPCNNYGSNSLVGIRMIKLIDNTHDRHSTLKNVWSMRFSMEGEGYYSELIINRDEWKNGNYYATTSFMSDIPLPYFSYVEYDILRLRKKEQDDEYTKRNIHKLDDPNIIKGAVFMARNCASLNNRETVVSEMIKHNNDKFRVESISSCLNNARSPIGNSDNKITVLEKYLFYLAFENQIITDYITEKLWHPYVAGIIPIYYGSSNVLEHVPNNSLIMLTDYYNPNDPNNNDITKLIKYIHHVIDNRTLFDSYQAWRKVPPTNVEDPYSILPKHFHKRNDISHTHSTCRTCRWAYNRMYNYGTWDHTDQTILPNMNIGIPKHACIYQDDSDNKDIDTVPGLIYQPFQEVWGWSNTIVGNDIVKSAQTITNIKVINNNNMENNDPNMIVSDPCFVDSQLHTIVISSNDINTIKLQRTVFEHDGIIDVYMNEFIDDGNNSTTVGNNDKKNIDGARYILRIKTLINDNTTSYHQTEPGRFIIQDSLSRFTILSYPMIDIDNNSQQQSAAGNNNNMIQPSEYGMVDIVIGTIPLRLRYITENVDTFHKDAYMYDNFFATMMTRDFYNPIESYILVQ